MKIGMHCFAYKVECRSALKLTRTYDGPKTFGSFSTRFTSRALSDVTINHDKANSLFSYVICWVVLFVLLLVV